MKLDRDLVFFSVGFLIGMLCIASVAWARNDDGRYDHAANKSWFESRHNSVGQWCCNEADGHPFDGEYALNQDGSVTLQDNGSPYRIEAFKVLKEPNPTGHAIWWFVEGNNGKMTYCFAPGPLT